MESVDDSFGEFESSDVSYDTREVLGGNKDYGKGVKVITNKVHDYYDQLTSYTYTDEATDERITVPIPQRWHPAGVFKRIITHNKIGQYTGVTLIGMSGCLVAGSKVILADGTARDIETFGKKSGEHINIPILNAYGEEEAATMFYKYKNKKIVDITTSNGTLVRGTYQHPLLTKNRGWVEMQYLRKGDVLQTANTIYTSSKPEKIIQVIKRRKRETVYDIHVPDSNTFVTNGGIISQNSGKTTLTRMFLHRIHEMGEHYIVKWFTGSDLTNIDKIIDSCIVGMPHILIFDDASYTLEDAGKSDVARLANALTTIRHHIKSRVITFMNIHYSKATKKFFRNQHFTFLTSISTEEMGNYADLFKDKMNVIRAFSKIYNKLMLHGYFEVPISSETYQTLRYTTNEPFRVGLVAEISDLHFFMYAKESCATCDPETEYNKLKDYHRFLEELIAAEGESQVRTTLEFFATIYEGHSKSYLNKKRQAIWRKLAAAQKNVKLPFAKMMEDMQSRRQRDTMKRGSKNVRQQIEMNAMHVAQQLQEENEAADIIMPKTRVGVKIPGKQEKPATAKGEYDSLYVNRDKTN